MNEAMGSQEPFLSNVEESIPRLSFLARLFAPTRYVSLEPYTYAHILDTTTNEVTLVVGPVRRALRSSESLARPPTPLVVVPPDSYAVVQNPHRTTTDARTGDSVPVLNERGQVELRLGSRTYCYHVAPFPLYPGEVVQCIERLRTVSASEALVIRVVQSYSSPTKDAVAASTSTDTCATRSEGEEYNLCGPATYYPRVEEEVVRTVTACVLPGDSAVSCRALCDFEDARSGGRRYEGEEYLMIPCGLFFPEPQESCTVVSGIRLGRDEGLYIKARHTYTDPRPPFAARGVVRQANSVFLVTGEDCPIFFCHPYDTIEDDSIRRIDVSPNQFCIVRNPKRGGEGGSSSTGEWQVRTNTSFFLQPGERVDEGHPRDAYIASQDEALLLTAWQDVQWADPAEGGAKRPVLRRRGEVWLMRGPCTLIPPPFVTIVPDPATKEEARRSVLLEEGTGLYVRHRSTGVVRCVPGPCSYLLGAEEEVWEKTLPSTVASSLAKRISHLAYIRPITADSRLPPPESKNDFGGRGRGRGGRRDRGRKAEEAPREAETLPAVKQRRAVTYDVPHRSVTQLYNYKNQQSRLVFGPDRVLVEPDEAFTVVSLSGSPWDPEQPHTCLPKQSNYITALHLFLGPSNMSDVVQVETRDHVQVALQLCYEWYFDVDSGNEEVAKSCFSVNDFVGDCCSFVASRVRAAVAAIPFEVFHRSSAKCLREAVFCVNNATDLPNTELRFEANRLVVTAVDIQGMEVLDAHTRRGLERAVKMSIEITTHAQQAEAQQIAMVREQEALGALERQRMKDQVDHEEQRRALLDVESQGLAITNTGKSQSAALAMSNAMEIEGKASAKAAKVRAEREKLLYGTMHDMQQEKSLVAMEHDEAVAAVTRHYERAMQEVAEKLSSDVIAAIGSDTMAEIAKAGPELQAKMLGSLGLSGYLVTDGSTPVNLFQTAAGFLGGDTKS